MIELSDTARITAGAVVLAAITVTSGGWFLLRITTGKVDVTQFQRRFFRAGHAHAGVFITLGLVCLLLAQATSLTGALAWLASSGVLVAAIVMPAAFFFAAMGPGRTSPNRWIWLMVPGVALLIAGLATLGVGLLMT